MTETEFLEKFHITLAFAGSLLVLGALPCASRDGMRCCSLYPAAEKLP